MIRVIDRGKPKNAQKNLSQCHKFATHSTRSQPKNPVLRCKSLTVDHLTFDTTMFNTFDLKILHLPLSMSTVASRRRQTSRLINGFSLSYGVKQHVACYFSVTFWFCIHKTNETESHPEHRLQTRAHSCYSSDS